MRRSLCLAILLSAAPVFAQAEEITVHMEGSAYTPAAIQATVGDRLVFVNDDVAAHNVFVPTSDHGVDLGKQEPGGTTVLPLGKAGRFEVECVIHPDMNLTVEVTR